MEVALVAIPTLAPIPYGKEITSVTLDEKFCRGDEVHFKCTRLLGSDDA